MSKFQSELAEQVHAVTMLGIGEEFGSVDEMGVHWTFLTVDDGLHRVKAGTPKEGHYVLIEDNQGFVNVVEYDTLEEWEEAKVKVERGVAEFYGEGDE